MGSMAKRRAPWQGTRSGARAGFGRMGTVPGRAGAFQHTAAGAMRRGRFSGYYRKGGFYGRYQGANAELKFHDVDLDDAVIATGGTITPTINIIAQGVTESTRVGRKCTIRGIGWRYSLSFPGIDAQANFNGGDNVRLIIYLDKQCNGAAATVGGDTGILATAAYQSFNQLAQKSRFRILCDKQITLNYVAGASDGAGVVSLAPITRQFKWFKKLNVLLEFDASASTGAIGTIRSNNLGALVISSAGTAGLVSKFRLRFSDS